MNHWPFPYKTLDGLNNFGGGGGTVTSISVTVPSWLSVAVTNPTTTPLIAITGSATGTGITVLQDSPTINTLLTVSGQLDIPRNSGSGHAVKITNAHAGVQDNYIEVGKNSSNRNHAHFGHHFEASGDAGNYAFIQTNNHFIKFAGTADFTFPATASANNGNLLFSTTAGVTSWSNTFNNGMTGYIFNSPVDFNAQVLINTNLILNSTLQVNGDLLVNQNTANGRLAYFYNDSVHENVGNQIYVGQDLSDSVQLGHYYATNLADRYAYLQTNNTKMIFTGEAAWKFPTTLGTSGQSLITNGAGVTSWADRVSAVSATVPSFMSVTVTNPNTTPAIAISAPSTGSGNVVLATSPTMSTPIIENFGTVSALIGQNAAATIVVRALTDVYITKYKPGAVGTLDNAFMITANPSSNSDTYFYAKGTNVGIFTQAPQESLDVQGSIRASNFIRFNNVSVYPGSSGVTSLYLPTSPGTNGQVLTSTGSGTAMSWTTPTTGTVTSVTGTSPIVSSGGATPDISLSTVPTTLGGTGLTTVGTNGQVLTSNGTTLGWTTPTTGTVTSVSAGTMPSDITMTIATGTTTPVINIAATTVGSNAFVRKDTANMTELTITGVPEANLYITSGTNGVGSLVNQSTLYLTQVGGGGGYVNQYIRAAYNATNGYHTSVNCNGDFVINSAKTVLDYGYIQGVNESVAITTNTQYNLFRSFGGVGIYGYKAGNNNDLSLRFASSNSYGTPNIGMSLTSIGNVWIGATSAPVASRLYVDGDYGTFSVNGTNANYWGFYMNGVRKSYIGIPDSNNELWLYNEHATGHIILQTSNANGLIRCAKPILLEEAVTLRKHTSSGNYTFRFPASMGTAGQVLTTDGTQTYWSTGGGGGGGTVNSVSASAPLASTGGTAPDIYIASATGTGSVVLNNAPTFDTQFYLDSSGTNDGYLKFVSVASANYIQSALQPTIGSAADLYFTSFNAASTWMTIKDTGNIGIGTTTPGCKVDVLTTLGNTAMRLKGTPESLILDGTDHVFMRYAWAGVNKAYVGFGNAGSPNFDISNVATGGHINLFPNANVGIGTTSPAAKLHVNGSLRVQGAAITQNGAQSEFSSGSYSDPDSGQVYNAKFGNTDPLSNGIAVKGNSRFTGVVVALGGFTNNITDIFTYATYTVPTSDIVMLGSNLNVGTYGIDCVGAALGNISYVDRFMFMCKAGNTITITFGINFGYVNNPTPGFNSMVLLCNNSGAFPIRKTSSTYSLYAQGACNYPSSITGVTNPLTMTAENITYAGGAYVGLSVTGQTGVVGYNPTFGQAGQKLYGSVTYIII